jgi:hypothetical protein
LVDNIGVKGAVVQYSDVHTFGDVGFADHLCSELYLRAMPSPVLLTILLGVITLAWQWQAKARLGDHNPHDKGMVACMATIRASPAVDKNEVLHTFGVCLMISRVDDNDPASAFDGVGSMVESCPSLVASFPPINAIGEVVVQGDKPIACSPQGIAQSSGDGRGMGGGPQRDGAEGFQASSGGCQQERHDHKGQRVANGSGKSVTHGSEEPLDAVGNAE